MQARRSSFSMNATHQIPGIHADRDDDCHGDRRHNRGRRAAQVDAGIGGGARDHRAATPAHDSYCAGFVFLEVWRVRSEEIAQLGPPPNAGLISSDLARGEKMGYRFAIVPAAEGYAVTARPHKVQGSTRSFYSDSSLVIRYAEGSQEATPESPSLGRGRLRLGGRVD